MIAADQAATLAEPFRRLNGDRTHRQGLGLGLSIVRAIAVAHDADLRVTPRPSGGLAVEVAFPPGRAAGCGVSRCAAGCGVSRCAAG
jgi:signal transduction histidine kinase